MTQLTDYRKSPYCDAFPPMTDQESAELEASIQRDIDAGVAEVEVFVSVNDSSLVLDGWHRLAACANLGIKPTIVHWEGDAGELAWQANMARRHLTPGDRARAILKVNELRVKEGKEPMGLREMAREADVSLGTIQYHTPDEPKKASEGGVYTDQIHTPQSGDDDGGSGMVPIYEEVTIERTREDFESDSKDEDDPGWIGDVPRRRVPSREKDAEITRLAQLNTDLEERLAVATKQAEGDTETVVAQVENMQFTANSLRTQLDSCRADNDRLRAENGHMASRIKQLIIERDGLAQRVKQLTATE